eukprot:TRINITY_DN4402_c0_g1_i2.p1 TRINITY_DN4402_c0_g1~~TRINITY_DN4402_c0_g1_i2.p1  ORF type:complete len:557 (-),score=89.47 TRINITY_DN4402_c0_g1_i2:264-1934(-)
MNFEDSNRRKRTAEAALSEESTAIPRYASFDLPADLVTLIISFLPVDDLVGASMVCKQWAQFVPEARYYLKNADFISCGSPGWRYLMSFALDFSSLRGLELPLRACSTVLGRFQPLLTQLTKLAIHQEHCTDALELPATLALFSQCSRLQHLHTDVRSASSLTLQAFASAHQLRTLSMPNAALSAQDLTRLGTNFPCLETLVCFEVSATSLSVFPALRTLDATRFIGHELPMARLESLTIAHLTPLQLLVLCTFGCVKTLCVTAVSALDAIQSRELIAKLSQTTQLRISSKGIKFGEFKGHCFPKLKALDILHCSALPAASCKAFPNLEHVSVTTNNEAVLKTVAQQFPAMRSVRLRYSSSRHTTRDGDSAVTALPFVSCVHLESISLTASVHLEGLDQVFVRCRKLKEVNISCAEMTEATLTALLRTSGHQLRTLQLNARFNCDVLTLVARNCPLLETFSLAGEVVQPSDGGLVFAQSCVNIRSLIVATVTLSGRAWDTVGRCWYNITKLSSQGDIPERVLRSCWKLRYCSPKLSAELSARFPAVASSFERPSRQ